MKIYRSASKPENLENVQVLPSASFAWLCYYHLQALLGCAIKCQFFCSEEVLFSLWLWASQDAGILVHCLPVRAEKVGCDLSDTFATHSGLVHDVMDPDWWAQKVPPKVMFLKTCKCQFLTSRTRNWGGKLLGGIGSACDAFCFCFPWINSQI